MSNKTRKHIRSGGLVATLAIVGVLAALLVLTWNPVATEAHDGGTATDHCSAIPVDIIAHDVAANLAGTTNADGSAHTCANPGDAAGTTHRTGTGGTGGTTTPAAGDMITVRAAPVAAPRRKSS